MQLGPHILRYSFKQTARHEPQALIERQQEDAIASQLDSYA